MEDGANKVVFEGSFVFTAPPPPVFLTGGTITGFKVYDGATLLLEASGHAIDYQAFLATIAAFEANPTLETAANFLELLTADQMILNGSSDIDHLLGGAFADIAFGKQGDDIVRAAAGDDSIFGNEGNDGLDGGDGADFLSGGQGNDALQGGDGADTADYSEKVELVAVTLNGSTISEVTVGGAVEDKITGVENINGGSGNDLITGDGFINRLVGNAGDDRIGGGDGNDLLFGSLGRDRLAGGAGNDELHGGEGSDILRGGADSDTFFFDTRLGKNHIDKIKDFAPVVDTIALEHDVFTTLKLGVLKGKFFHAGSEAHDADDRVIYDEGTGALYYDRDGTGGAVQVQFARLNAHLGIDASDFLIV